MANAPKLFRPHHHQPHPQAQREKWKATDDRRGTAASRGYDRRWKAFRDAFIAMHPLCVACEAAGLIVPAAVVDHIVPHGGDMGLFWQDGNHQSLCKVCHDRKTATEDGGFGRGGVNWHPEFLRPLPVPMMIVCGAPLAGKSWYVDRHRGNADIVVDLDCIASEMAGTELHAWPQSRLTEFGRERNRRLLALAVPGAVPAGSRVWLVVAEPSMQWRQWWHDKMQPEAIVVMETPRHVCAARARADRVNGDEIEVAIDRWWRDYRRRPGDTVVTPREH